MRTEPTNQCTVRERRAGMTEAEFWADVFPQGDDESDEVEVVSLDADQCLTCGECGPCGYDLDGRPLIHASEGDD